MRNCNRSKKLFSMYLDDLLDGHKRQQLDAHLSSCSRCREEIEQMRAVTRSLNALPKVSSSDSFDLVLQARLRQQIRQEVPNHTIRWLPFRYRDRDRQPRKILSKTSASRILDIWSLLIAIL